MRHTIARVATTAALVAFLLSVLALVLIGLGPLSGRYRLLTVLSGSMRPTAPQGSVVVETPMPLSTVRVGDVISYHIPVGDHRVVTHRIVEIRSRGASPVVVTKGDANRAPDPWVATLHGEVAWRMRFAVPGLGWTIRALRSPLLHRITTLGVPLLLAAVWIGAIWRPRPASDRRPGRELPHT
ncbi:MAG: signal peptidase I [Acidimicrobiia bacterium]|nr:signal peptidase I [Acidimicrobiia bacterium]MBV9042082.1 signal peptidase I [Acidimicrobiia bacterium]